MTKNIACLLLLAINQFAVCRSSAQEFHFTQFNAVPLVLNPAFTGMTEGAVRVSAIYRNQWASITAPYNTIGASVDGRVITMQNKDYIGLGAQLLQDQIADGQLKNFSGTASISYHKLFRYDSLLKLHRCDLSIGLQGGYSQRSIDLSRIYFGNGSLNYLPSYYYATPYHLGVGNAVNYYSLNAGIAFSQKISSGFDYTIGISINNINQPNDALLKQENEITGAGLRFTGVAGFNWTIAKRWTIRPAIIYINNSYTELLSGSELLYKVPANRKNKNAEPGIFLGAWYRTNDIVMMTAGIEVWHLRLGVAYDYPFSAQYDGNGGFEIMARYIAPGHRTAAKRKNIPCNRF
jgi:type IX secretion system PorP/SprF family membrane protein